MNKVDRPFVSNEQWPHSQIWTREPLFGQTMTLCETFILNQH